MVFEALRYTQERIMQYPEFSNIKQQWTTFSIELIDWAKNRIPDEHQSLFLKYRNEFVANLSK